MTMKSPKSSSVVLCLVLCFQVVVHSSSRRLSSPNIAVRSSVVAAARRQDEKSSSHDISTSIYKDDAEKEKSITSSTTSNDNAVASSSDRELIVRGSDAPVGSYPWYASLHKAADTLDGLLLEGFYCGGQLVDPNFVLSAAHCEVSVNDLVLVGNLCSTDASNCGQTRVTRRVKKVLNDPLYETDLFGGASHDFVLIELSSTVTTIEPVALDDGTYSPSYVDGKSLWAAGMGYTSTTPNTLPLRLQEIEVEYVPDDICKRQGLGIPLGDASTLCSRYPGEPSGGTCSGDSGGPLYDKENGVLVGITSYGSYYCGTPLPDVFGRISDKFSWIRSTICSIYPDSVICSQTAKPTTSPAPTSQWCDDANVEIEINPDLYYDENVFYIKDMQSNQIITARPLVDVEPDVTQSGNLCLPISNQECYAFGILDYYGDGIDLYGTDPDYCIKVNGQVIACNTNFTGALETVVFPQESCNLSCSPSHYTLDIATQRNTDFALSIQDTSGIDIDPYIFEGTNSFVTFSVPVDLCKGCYQIQTESLQDVTFALKDKDTNQIILSNSDFSTRGPSVVAFGVGGVEGCVASVSSGPFVMNTFYGLLLLSSSSFMLFMVAL